MAKISTSERITFNVISCTVRFGPVGASGIVIPGGQEPGVTGGEPADAPPAAGVASDVTVGLFSFCGTRKPYFRAIACLAF